ncbi:hypothetical protein EXS72_02725 [Candidatus Pacearchaeota archaeon]|nr:hypothetical protein [Candidatus Pacearchaeota archaeon]
MKAMQAVIELDNKSNELLVELVHKFLPYKSLVDKSRVVEISYGRSNNVSLKDINCFQCPFLLDCNKKTNCHGYIHSFQLKVAC